MLRTTVSGSAFIGVFCAILGDVGAVRPDIEAGRREAIAAELDIPVHPTTVGGGSTIGSLLAGNRSGAVVSKQATATERETLTELLDRPVEPLPDTLNAAGNLVLATEAGALVHPELGDEAVTTVADTLSVPVERATIGGIQTVGMAAVATDQGVLCHPQASEAELDTLESVLDVPADLGTVNYGSPLVGSGLLATGTGYVVGERTTGPELGRIEDALSLID